MIAIESLSRTYGRDVQALRGIELQVGEGMFGLVGPNGAGKTTLMRILAGLLRPSGGRVTVFGHDVATRPGRQAVKATLGYLPQELGLYPDLTAREFLEYIALLKGLGEKQARRRQVSQLLAVVGLGDAADRRLRTYSGGMKRRVGVAQALLGDPRLLIVDEPTAGLDPEERVHVRNLLAEMAGSRMVILSTHIVEDVSQSCTDLAVLDQGQVIFRGRPHELIDGVRGKVWRVTTHGDKLDADWIVVSTRPLETGIECRVIGEPPGDTLATPVEPSLEDAYLWLMHGVHG